MAAVQAEEETQALFDLCPDLLSISGFDGYLKVVNRAWTDTLGWSREELLSRPYGDLLHPDDVERTVAAAEDLLAGEPVTGFENRYRHRDGSYRWLSWDATSDVGRERMYAAIRDVTAERRRDALQQELEAISGVGTWELDPDEGRVHWSAGTHRIHATDPDTFDPHLHDALAFYPEPARVRLVPALERLQRDGTPYDLELPFLTIDGRSRWIRTTATSMRRDGHVLRLYGTIRDITEVVEERLRLRRFRDLLELSEEGIAELDPDGRITYANARFAELAGRDVAHLEGRPLEEVVVDEPVGRRVLTALRGQGSEDQVVRGELRLADPAGERVVQASARIEGPGRDTSGYVTLVATDVTQRRHRELELTRTTALLEEAQRTARIGHWRLDVVTGELEVSPIVAEIVADGDAEVTLREYLRAVHPEDRGRVRLDRDLRAFRRTTGVVHRLRTPAGDARTVHLHVTPVWDDATDTLLVLQGTLQDVTALHRTESALQRVLTATNDGWFDEDVAGDRGSYSDRWWEIHGLTPPAGPLPGGVWRRFVPEAELPGIEARFSEAVASQAPTLRLDGHVQHALGHLVPVVVRLSLEYDRDGRLNRVTGATSDVTEQVQAERAKDAFVSTVSHELRTPLTAIGGALELLAEGRGGTLPGAARPLVDIGLRNTHRLHALISDLLDIEQLRTGSIAMDRLPQRLAPILEDVVQDLGTVAEAAEVTLSLEVEDPALEVRADATRIAQVATNLVSNALKFAPAGTPVRIRVRRLGHRALVEVLDTGPGLPPSFRERAFERFAQADPEDPRSRGGTGLGLAISREIVRQHEGAIGYDSVPGDTRFWVELPLLGSASVGSEA